VNDADPATMTEAQRTQLKRAFENVRRSLALSTLVDSLRRQAKVEIARDSE
jgi:hypothetical protein